MPAPTLESFSDYTEMLSVHSGAGATAYNQAVIRQAVMKAYDDLNNGREWSYMTQHGRIITSAPVTTSSGTTVSYTQSTRAALHSATAWSSLATWYLSGRLKLGGVVSAIDSAVTTTATLNTILNPGENVSATTDWILFRNIYSLPHDFLAMHEIHNEAGYYGCQIPHDEAMRIEREQLSPMADPFYFSIVPDPDNYAQMAIYLPYWPEAVETLDFVYLRRPRQLLITGLASDHTVGTVSNTSTAVTGVGTNFNSNMIGSLFRFGTASELPTALFGTNPYVDQRTIIAVGSTTGLTLDSAPSTNYSAVKYRVSDPIDLRPTMLDAFLRGTERHLAIISNSKNVIQADALWEKAMRRAYAADRTSLPPSNMRAYDWPHGAGFTND